MAVRCEQALHAFLTPICRLGFKMLGPVQLEMTMQRLTIAYVRAKDGKVEALPYADLLSLLSFRTRAVRPLHRCGASFS